MTRDALAGAPVPLAWGKQVSHTLPVGGGPPCQSPWAPRMETGARPGRCRFLLRQQQRRRKESM
eukprot:403351-Pelagomonas_calceolata.AAC.5